ncbi:MAG TPA: glutamine synthetase III [Rhabdochlamydiaceae bacterium]
MNIRYKLLRDILKRQGGVPIQKRAEFGHLTFHMGIMEKMLPKNIIANLKDAKEGKSKLNPQFAGAIAQAMQQWAVGLGCTHFCHWFQPMTGLAAEKQDAFLDWNAQGHPIEKFSGKQLMRGEPDASSLPSGGLRSTHAARGYTTWDPTSTPFLWDAGGTRILCLPSIFFSLTGKALDMKIPLLRSEAKINHAVLRLLALFRIRAESVHATLGCEQEYFLIDRAYFLARPDLMLSGRTLWGASPAKGQELEDHYFGTLKERVAAFMTDLEHRAWALGIPLKTRHNEVAPNQFEAAPIFERISLAVDHNILLMELMRQVATRHNLACLLHEKPFAGINGSGKHCNWSLSTDEGQNLFDPHAFGNQEMPFLLLIAAVLRGVHEHAALVRAAIATPGNDHRLGGHEAPPPIISVYLGQALENVLTLIEEDRVHKSREAKGLDLKVPPIPELPFDESDRNRTSPFPFTGYKFEFRAVGASQNPALPVTLLNAIVAESLNHIVDSIEKDVLKNKKSTEDAVLAVLRREIKQSRPIRFSGNNYSPEWRKEAQKRKLPIIEKSVHAMDVFLDPSAIKVFEGVLSKEELSARVEIAKQRYCKILNIETSLLQEGVQTRILPAAIEWQKNLAESIKSLGAGYATSRQKALLKKVSLHIDQAFAKLDALEKNKRSALELPLDKQVLYFSDRIAESNKELRKDVDALETLLDDRLWPSPKYSEMLHII